MRNGTGSLIFLVLMIAVFYFLLIRPQQRQARRIQQLQTSLQLGDEVLTVGGLVGTIRRFDGDLLTLELNPGIEARVHRRSVQQKIQPPAAEEPDTTEGNGGP